MDIPSLQGNGSPTGGAVGAGLVLVLFPCGALFFGSSLLAKNPEVGLPILAIFGIMILFGSMALVSTLFNRLNLSDAREALALPPGSIRAAIALALIVLFSIISIMLFQSMAKPYIVHSLDSTDKAAIVGNVANRVLAVITVDCPPPKPRASTSQAAPVPAPVTVPVDVCYDVHLVQPPGQDAFDLAKQLLIMIGTLMTSVTSFYFATQATAASKSSEIQNAIQQVLGPAGGGATMPAASRSDASQPLPDHDHDAHADGCNVPITDETPDTDLPPTKGGVSS